ncbi:MAG: pyridoxamine 5'-phosphate oxidase family protein [Rhodospirillales bacterium]
MTTYTSDVAFTDTVKTIQGRKGSRNGYAKMEAKGGWQDRVTPDLAAFIAARDSFYLATANAGGQPYIQHRGGRPGFLKVINDRTLAFADFTGNRQYISQGNLQDNSKAFIFLMDYANRRRVKIWGTARVVEDDPVLIQSLTDTDYADGTPEQAMVFEITAWDINCPQHITPRFTEADIARAVEPLHARIRELEAALEIKR